MKASHIFFDLDGTLVDSKPGITRCVSLTLADYGITADPEELTAFIGPPLKHSFQKYYKFSDETVDSVVARYREYYGDTGVFDATVYEGVHDMLSAIAAAGKKIFLATAKEERYALQVLEHFNLIDYFTFVGGSRFLCNRITKADVLKHIARECKEADLSRGLMVGDREHDVEGAKAVGMPCAAVLYGYGSQEELENAGASYFFSTVKDLHEALLKS